MRRLVIFLTFVASWLVMGPSSAQSCLGPGTYEEHDLRISYFGTWTVYQNSQAFGGSGRFANYVVSPFNRISFTACTDVASVVLYQVVSPAFTGPLQVTVNGNIREMFWSAVGIVTPQYSQRLVIPLTPGGTSVVEVMHVPPKAGTVTPLATFISVEGLELRAANPTAGAIVVNLPTHTPTPTATHTPTPTPTLTPTTGPSPTMTPTATRTPNYIFQATVSFDGNSRDVGLVYQITAGDVGIVLLLALVLVILLVSVVLSLRRQ
jgi:hypothetical protein